jgi:hypothetical protein
LIAYTVYNFQAELENHKEPDWQGAIMGLISEVFPDNSTKGFFPRTNGVTRIVARLVATTRRKTTGESGSDEYKIDNTNRANDEDKRNRRISRVVGIESVSESIETRRKKYLRHH